MIAVPEEVKQLFKRDGVNKNIRIHFPGGERGDIVNDHIVQESFSFTESVCSRDTLRFGLCESSVLQFECVDVENIQGCEIEAYCEIDISDLGQECISSYGNTSDDVSFVFYQVPLGTFVVDSCQRQADMKKRKVVAYSKEMEWNTIPNPLERAKIEGDITMQYNSPYTYNVAAVVYSNVYTDAGDRFEEKQLCECSTNLKSCYSTTSKTMIRSPDGLSGNAKYSIQIQRKDVILRMATAEMASKLYWLDYEIFQHAEEVRSELKSIFEDSTYGGWKRDNYKAIIEELIDSLYGGEYETSKFDSGLYNKIYINLEQCRYVYPFMNYTSEENPRIYENYLTCIRIPYQVIVTITEYAYSQYNLYYEKEKNEEIIDVRDREGINIYEILNLPEIYHTIERKECAEEENTYVLDNSSLSLRDVIEAFCEFRGMFGRYTRYGTFEFFDLEGSLGVFPSETLFPEENLYPAYPNAGVLTGSHYRTAWYDDEPTKLYDRVSLTYNNTEGKEMYAWIMMVNEEMEGYVRDDYQTYSLTDNYLVKNGTFTAEQIKEILADVASKIKHVQYMPADVELIGLPWVEAGDAITLMTADGAIEMFILRRTLSGIQCLSDNYESKG